MMTAVRCRKAVPDDADHLALLGAASFLETYAGLVDRGDILKHCRDNHSRETYAQWLGSPDAAIWLVETRACPAPVGYLVLDRPDLPVAHCRGDVEIKRFYLLNRFQGGGHGRQLLEAALEDARDGGAARALLGVFTRNERAITFYAKAGFTPIGTRRFQVGQNVYDDLVLARALI